MKHSEFIFNILLVPVDYLMLVLAGTAAYFLRVHPLVVQYRPVLFFINLPFGRYFELVLMSAAAGVVLFAFAGLYKMKTTRSSLEEIFHIAIASSAGIMLVIVYVFLRAEYFDSRFIILAAWIFAVLFVSFGRISARQIQKYLVKNYEFGVHKVLIVGKDEVTEKIIGEINRRPSSGYRVAKHLSAADISSAREVLAREGVDEVIFADPNYSKDEITEFIDFCETNHLIFKFVPNLFQILTVNFDVDIFTGVPLIELKRTPLDGWGKVAKRAADVFGSIAGLILLSPFFILVGFAVKLDSSGPVFVALKRVSRNKEFFLYKFRSMVVGAEKMKRDLMALNERKDGPLFKMENDPRITRFGKILRKFRLDEFPQLFNVLKGDISLVGPRPHEQAEIERYQKHHKKVLAIKSGITGLAQVNGSSDLPFEEEVKLDTYYIENWSLWLDFKILVKTAWKMFSDTSAI